MTHPAFRSRYSSKAQSYVNFVDDSIFQYWMEDFYGGRIAWIGEDPRIAKSARWNDKASHLAMMGVWLWRATGNRYYRDYAVRVGQAFQRELRPNGPGWIWDRGTIPLGSDTNDEPGSVGNLAGVPDTAHANREPMMMIMLYENGLVFSRDDCRRMTRTVTDILWKGDLSNPLYANYLDGSNRPYRTRREPSSNGLVYLGWVFTGRFSVNAQKGFSSLVRGYENGIHNASISANAASWALVSLTGHLLRNLSISGPVLYGIDAPAILPLGATVRADTAFATKVRWTVAKRTTAKRASQARYPSQSKSGSLGAVAASLITNDFDLALGALPLSAGDYTIQAQAEDEEGVLSELVQADVTLVQANFDQTRVFPNPWRADLHSVVEITFDRLTPDSTIKIFTIAGHWVRTLSSALGDPVRWDLKNNSGDHVASGLYLYLITNPRNERIRGTVAVIKLDLL
jgi:hypothetical protein